MKDLKQLHCIYTDNYYTSLILYESLLEKGIYSSGTVIKTSRYFPNKLFQENTLLDQGGAFLLS